jgi:6-phospho-beta-glucosidase
MSKSDLNLLKLYPVDFISFSYYASQITKVHDADKNDHATEGNMITGGSVKNPYLKTSE